jgi:hypothetical protein
MGLVLSDGIAISPSISIRSAYGDTRTKLKVDGSKNSLR